MKLILSILLNGLVVFVIAELLDGVHVANYVTAVVAAVILGLLNFFIRPLLKILALPITLLTLGLFSLVINGAVVLLADRLVDGFEVNGLVWAVIFAVALSVVNFFLGKD